MLSRQIPRNLARARRSLATTAYQQPSQNLLLLSGVAGGLTAFTAGYAWYHFSGTATVVKNAQSIHNTLQTAKNATPGPGDIYGYIRSVVESQIPGSSVAFRISEKHGEEIGTVLKDTTNELWEAIEKGGDNVKDKVTEILKRRGEQLKNAGKDAGEKLLSEYPAAQEKLGGAYDELKSLGDQYGPEGKKAVEEVYNQTRDIFKNGVSTDSIAKAVKLAKDKTEQLQQIGTKEAEKAWTKAQDEAKKQLEKAPAIKKVLEENMGALKSGGLSAAMVPGIFNAANEYATKGGDMKENAEKFRQYIQETLEKGKDKVQDTETWQMVEKYMKAIPGGENVIKEIPDLNEWIELGKKKGPEAEKLLKETWDEITSVLEKKLEEAKKLKNKD